MSKLSIGIMANITINKYHQQLLACYETWIKTASDNNVKVCVFVGDKSLQPENNYDIICLDNVGEDYESASYKQFYGLQYMIENIDSEFYMIVGSDTYPNISKILKI